MSIKKVVCAISGGVDSCVAAYLLKTKGFNVHGVFMRNWDAAEEASDCSIDEDAADAAYVCKKLDIPFTEVNFVREYWNEVFCELIDGYRNGITPNPDVLCNRRIKFGYFLNHAVNNLGADYLATGHYARSSLGQFGERPLTKKGVDLLKPKDLSKDQTLFLSQVKQESLQKTMFPIGGLLKTEVKEIAREINMHHIAGKKESAGICFIGRRNFQDFMHDYVKPMPGYFIEFDSGKLVGKHKGVHLWTVGQRALIGGLNIAYFVLRKSTNSSNIYVVAGSSHPALYSDQLILDKPHWINRNPFSNSNQVSDTLNIQTNNGFCGKIIEDQTLYDFDDCLNKNSVTNATQGVTSTAASERYNTLNASSEYVAEHSNIDYSTPLFIDSNAHPQNNRDDKNAYCETSQLKETGERTNLQTKPVYISKTDTDYKLAGEMRPDNALQFQFRFQHPHTPIGCSVSLLSSGELRVKLSQKMRAIAPGQYGVLYDGQVCLGSSPIVTVVTDRHVESRISQLVGVQEL